MKTGSLFLGSISSFACCLGITLTPAQAQSLQWLHRVPGSYNSQILNGNDLTPSTTEFFLSKTGAIIGSYGINEDSGLVLGALNNCEATGSLMLSCTWSDRYGSGILDITFNPNLSQFDGKWRLPNSEETYPWTGSRANLTP